MSRVRFALNFLLSPFDFVCLRDVLDGFHVVSLLVFSLLGCAELENYPDNGYGVGAEYVHQSHGIQYGRALHWGMVCVILVFVILT